MRKNEIMRSGSGVVTSFLKGPSIYDVHTEKGGGQAQVDACGRGRGSSPMWTSTQI